MIYGQGLDDFRRCLHYHGENDIVALLCDEWNSYYACFKCHDTLSNHRFQSTGLSNNFPIKCGCCCSLLSRLQYKRGFCPYCHHAFNPKCQNHDSIYFKKE